MKTLVVLAVILTSNVALAKNSFKIDMNLEINGKPVSSPTLVVLAGEEGSITIDTEKEKSFFEVLADEGNVKGKKGILLKMKVGHFQKDGSTKVVAKPTILTKNGEEALIIIGDDKEEMTLKVVATRESN